MSRRGAQVADEGAAAQEHALPYVDPGPSRSKRIRTEVGGSKVRRRERH